VPAPRSYQAARTLQALTLLAEGPLSVPELAQALSTSDPAARRLIARLEHDHYVHLVPDTKRRRYRLADGAFRLALALMTDALRQVATHDQSRGNSLGARLRAYRHAHGLSQEAFVQALGVDRSYYSSIERGLRRVTIEDIMELAAAIGEDPLALLMLR
jgi:DNA-binding XRE family transcriptional regulator